MSVSTEDHHDRTRAGLVPVVLVAEALVVALFRVAADARFDGFAFFDPGAELGNHLLIARGLRPTIDFGYIYGLLSLLAGEAWYALLGLTPGAFVAAVIASSVLVAWGLARIVVAVRAGGVGLGFVGAMIPIGLSVAIAPSFTHVLEPILLVHAVAEVARGRHERGLALAAISLFVKPSMSFLLGGMIFAAIFVRYGRTRAIRSLVPALAIALGLALVLAARFGIAPLLATLAPRGGYEVYRRNGYGFFAAGRAFWLPRRPSPGYYATTLAGPWLAASLVLFLGAIAQISPARRARARSEGRVPEGIDVVAICALAHLGFVGFFFGNQWSWSYYFPLLVAGGVAVSARGRSGRIAVLVLTVLSLPAALLALRGPGEAWTARSASPETYGLWASPTVVEEWTVVKRMTRGTRPAVLAVTDGLGFLDRDFGPPEVAFLVRGHALSGEIARKTARIRGAEFVVVANPHPGEPWHDTWPEFAEALSRHRRVWECPRLRLYRAETRASSTSSKKSR